MNKVLQIMFYDDQKGWVVDTMEVGENQQLAGEEEEEEGEDEDNSHTALFPYL